MDGVPTGSRGLRPLWKSTPFGLLPKTKEICKRYQMDGTCFTNKYEFLSFLFITIPDVVLNFENT